MMELVLSIKAVDSSIYSSQAFVFEHFFHTALDIFNGIFYC